MQSKLLLLRVCFACRVSSMRTIIPRMRILEKHSDLLYRALYSLSLSCVLICRNRIDQLLNLTSCVAGRLWWIDIPTLVTPTAKFRPCLTTMAPRWQRFSSRCRHFGLLTRSYGLFRWRLNSLLEGSRRRKLSLTRWLPHSLPSSLQKSEIYSFHRQHLNPMIH